ncbi:MAG: hypothetical protein NVV72_02120 [Asticcacaulis sp.]|nr:hypothetical protein [Asticcacaulis sp.]
MKTTFTSAKALIAMIVMSAGLATTSLPAQASPQGHAPAAAAHAQYGIDAGRKIEARIQELKGRLADGRRSVRISRSEGSRLATSLNSIVSLKRQYERSGRGLSQPEINTLNTKLDTLSGKIRVQAHDGNRR